jgi:hypothetical protein
LAAFCLRDAHFDVRMIVVLNDKPVEKRSSSAGVTGGSASTGVRIGPTEHFVRVGDWRNPTFAAAVGAVSDLISHNVPIAVVAGVAAELAQRYEHLEKSETSLFDLLGRLAQGGSIYKVWIAEDQLLDAMDSEMDRDDRRRLLANMKSRGVLEEGAGKWRAVW